MSKITKRKVIYEQLSEKWFHGVSPEAEQHLRNSMRSLEKAQAPLPAVPLYGKEDWSVVTDFYAYAQRKGIVYPKWQLEYELSRESKFGDQGGHAAWKDLKPEVEMYVTNVSECHAPIIPETIEKYKSLNCNLKSLQGTLANQIAEDKIQDKASGWRTFNLKKSDPKAQASAIRDARDGNWRNSWAYIFSYVKKQKNRIFIPAPFCVNILQAQYHDPLLTAIQNDLHINGANSKFSFFGDKASFKTLFEDIMPAKRTQFNHQFSDKKGKVVYVVRDFYHMDTTQGPTQKAHHYIPKVAAAFHIRAGSEAYDRLSEIMLYSNRFSIATPDGMITNNDKGEGSGATVTNQGEGCSNEDFDYVLNERIISKSKEEGIEVYRIDSYGNGDDGISRYFVVNASSRILERFYRIVDEQADITCKEFGFIKNDKWRIGTDFGIYCQYELYEDENGHLHNDYPASLAINAGMHMLRALPKKQWDRDYIDDRWIQILAPLYGRKDFTILVDYVDNGLKDGLLGRSREDMIRILRKYRKYRALQESSVEFNIYNSEWDDNPLLNPVIQYLMEKRGIKINYADIDPKKALIDSIS